MALLPSGRGGVGAILSGPATKPSAVVFPFSVYGPQGKPRVSGRGVGLQDGESQYTGRPRFGDYSGSAVEFGLWAGAVGGGEGGSSSAAAAAARRSSVKAAGTAVWFSSEYIAQSCTLAQFQGEEGSEDECPLHTCGCTRAERANYGTRVTRLEAH